jgi:hypothetical protein
MTSKGWSDWEKAAKKQYPVRYWIAEDMFDYLQDIVNWPADRFHSVRYYINNRWVSRSHALTAHPRDIKPGEWHDLGSRFVLCMFNELVDFVEVETAWHHVMWNDEARAEFEPPWWRRGVLRWRGWRSPEAGIAHLEWAASLTWDHTMSNNGKMLGKPTHQAIAAMEILELYHWWTEERPNRPDANDASGWSAICERRRLDHPDEFMPEDNSKKERAESMKAIKLSGKIEKQYEDEDERMMIRLIKIRGNLWT